MWRSCLRTSFFFFSTYGIVSNSGRAAWFDPTKIGQIWTDKVVFISRNLDEAAELLADYFRDYFFLDSNF